MGLLSIVKNPASPCIICLQVSEGLIDFHGSCKCRPRVHPSCLKNWFERNSRTCPICRVPFGGASAEMVRDASGNPTPATSSGESGRPENNDDGPYCLACLFMTFLLPFIQH